MKLGKSRKTDRGFGRLEFTDLYGEECSMQQSSLADKDAIWLGISKINPIIMVLDAIKLGLPILDGKNGWLEYKVPKEVLMSSRMHLGVKEVKALIKCLQSWVDTGTF